MTIHTLLADFDPIDLDGLNAVAALQTRTDRKYIVRIDDLAGILAELPETTRALEIDGQRTQAYASRYFDTANLDSFRGAAHGRRRRFKVRTRTYLGSGTSFLEIKTRGQRGDTVKDRVPLTTDLADATIRDTTAKTLDAAGIDSAHQLAHALRPVLDTSYRRATLLLSAGTAARATIDVDLHWKDSHGTTLALPSIAVVETKSAGTPTALDRALWRRGHRPTPISKYATGLAALRPSLPRNKWHRTINQHFTPRQLTLAA